MIAPLFPYVPPAAILFYPTSSTAPLWLEQGRPSASTRSKLPCCPTGPRGAKWLFSHGRALDNNLICTSKFRAAVVIIKLNNCLVLTCVTSAFVSGVILSRNNSPGPLSSSLSPDLRNSSISLMAFSTKSWPADLSTAWPESSSTPCAHQRFAYQSKNII